ncbi:MAG: sigma 54-interacting transcriptional regulator [Deltaproteobacteria bacterium]|nr:sigma 54-interacting transcriptional regulator [Deltaproteobacteria bacterium]
MITPQIANMERLLSTLSAQFISMKAGHVTFEIEKGLAIIGKYLGAERCSFFEWSDEQNTFLTYSWAISCDKRFPSETMGSDRFPWSVNKLLKGEIIYAQDLEDYPPEAVTDKKYLRKSGIMSTVVIPIIGNGKVVAAITTATLSRQGYWSDEAISYLRFAGEIFTNAIIRKNYEESLQNQIKELSLLKKKLELDNLILRKEIDDQVISLDVTSKDSALKPVLEKITQVAPTETPVFILGETGVGKALIARAVHNASLRRNRPMVTVNCASLQENLIESEFFGHERGAFTNAIITRIGRFELAKGGTLFLDEIGELPLTVQGKLLRVLQDNEYERVGSSKTKVAEVRIIAATNRDVEKEMAEGNFRSDLYYRLNVFPLHVPPLRERPQDIEALVEYFLRHFNKKIGRSVYKVDKRTMAAFRQYPWPGNIRELRNIIERGVIAATGNTLAVELPQTKQKLHQIKTLEYMERKHILNILEDSAGRIEGEYGAAVMLGIKASTLRSKMQKLGISRKK